MRILLALILMLGVAHGDTRYTRKQPDIVVAKARAKPKVAVPKPLTADEAFAIEADKQPIKQQQEALLIKLLRATPDDDADKPDYLFRLAELYAQQQCYWRLKATEP